jgi:hypothetical protein
MKIVPVYVWNHLPSADNRDGVVARSEQPVLPEVIEERRTRFRQLQDQDPQFEARHAHCFQLFRHGRVETRPDRHVAGCTNWCTAHLWIVPAKVEGTWKLPQGELALKQR